MGVRTPNGDIELGRKLKEEDVPPTPVQAHQGRRNQIIDGACIGLNTASTVLLVFLNKWYATIAPSNTAKADARQ
jgi:hypothetical protein